MLRFDWSELMKILDAQDKLNEELQKRLKSVESRLAKLEKKPSKKKEEK